jgi:hypothetical protein
VDGGKKERVDRSMYSTDDRDKNGIKPQMFGRRMWIMWEKMAMIMNNYSSEMINFVDFMMLMYRALVQCTICRRGYKTISSKPQFDPKIAVRAHCLPEGVHLIHEAVNHKLDKPLYGHPPRQSVLAALGQKESRLTTPYSTSSDLCGTFGEEFKPMTMEDCFGPRCEGDSSTRGTAVDSTPLFWAWIRSIAFNFSSGIRLDDYWDGKIEHQFTYPDGSDEQKELKERLNIYITFFDLLMNFIDRRSELSKRWIQAYFLNTPTPMTFASRTKLLVWIYQMHKACGYEFPCYTCTTTTSGTGDDESKAIKILQGEQTFIEMLEQLHPTRSLAVVVPSSKGETSTKSKTDHS